MRLLRLFMVGLPVAAAALLALPWGAVLAAAGAGNASRGGEDRTVPPIAAAPHVELRRRFHTREGGLAPGAVRALAVARDGSVLAACEGGVARRSGDRWSVPAGPADVTTLLALPAGPLALAAARDGVWALDPRGGWRREADSPPGQTALAPPDSGTPDACWSAGAAGLWRRVVEGTAARWHRVHEPDEDLGDVRALCAAGDDRLFAAGSGGLFGLMGKRRYWLNLEVRPGGLVSRDVRTLAPLGAGHFLVATDRGLQLTDFRRGWDLVAGREGLPIPSLTHAAASPDGTIWAGSSEGLMRCRAGRWTYLAGLRWLPDDRITALAVGPDGTVWAGTPAGVAEIYEQRMTLEEKAAHYQSIAEGRNRRHGYVTVMHLEAPGRIEGAQQELSDNDGLWTALYLSSQSFRYAVNGDRAARSQASRAMQALLRLESITGISGFPARAIVHRDEPQFARRSTRSLPEWRPSPSEPGWWWKGDTSSDELDGHYFAWYLFHDLAATDEEKRRVRETCKRVTDHILDHGYYLVDHDGKPTTWGVWAPEKLNDDPIWWAERGLNSLEILSHLKVAHHLVGDARYERAYRELIEKHHYALNATRVRLPVEDGVSHDDQLAFLAFYPLLRLERDPALRALYLTGLRRLWEEERVERNPLWNFIYGACSGEPCDAGIALETLQEMPLDLIVWKVRNSHRADLRFDPELERRGVKRLLRPLSWRERIVKNWDGDPFQLDGGSDLGEGDPTIWLLPYWMGRHHRLIR